MPCDTCATHTLYTVQKGEKRENPKRGKKRKRGTRRAVNQAATRHSPSLRGPTAISLTFADLPAYHPARVCVNNNACMQRAHRRVAPHCDSDPRCEPKAASTVSPRMIFSAKNVLLEREIPLIHLARGTARCSFTRDQLEAGRVCFLVGNESVNRITR